jgi:hypothetical protein
MICVRIEGGLGNQMFQYAAGRALAIRHKTDLILDISPLQQNMKKYTSRELEVDKFCIKSNFSRSEEFRNMSFLRRVPALSKWLSSWNIFAEDSLMFNSDFEKLPDKTYLSGYWQSFRYFSDISQDIYSDFKPREELSLQSKEIALKIESCESVALHVRRGDYVSLKSAAHMHGTLSNSYYTKAIGETYDTLVNPFFFIFSDDPDWCKLNLKLPSRSAIFICHNTGPSAWQDLMLMSQCRHNIIANSSFSWWGAWLADQMHGTKNRLVFAPQQWFSGQSHDTKDRFPNHWKVVL